jgi:DNA replication and repair protein RecF
VILQQLRLFCFRVYKEQVFLPSPGLNLLTGPNGAGKTAILEALHLLSAARSFRATREYELCHWGESACLVEGKFVNDQGHPRELSLRWQRIDGEWKKQATLQGDALSRLAEFLDCVPLSLFTPTDLELVNGAPSVRRKYLDLTLSKLSSVHLQELARLKKVLSSRNALLRQGRPQVELRPWDRLLYQLSVSVGARREQLVADLNEICQDFFRRLTDKEKGVKLVYKRCWPQDWEGFQERLVELEERERRRGSTLLSPQKDDLDIQRHERSLRNYGSQGEQRIVSLCLRLAEAKQLADKKQESAILLLDDAFSELDPEKKERLLAILPEFSQALVTSASPLGSLASRFHCHEVKDGQINRATVAP